MILFEMLISFCTADIFPQNRYFSKRAFLSIKFINIKA